VFQAPKAAIVAANPGCNREAYDHCGFVSMAPMPCSPISWCQLFTSEWLTVIGTVGATVVALALGLGFGDWVRGKFVRPKLELDATIASPTVQLMPLGNLGGAWYFRLKITNTGNAPAREVQVFLASVEEWEGTQQKFVPAKRFLPMFLRWSNVGATTTPTLWPDMPRFCDWFHIADPNIKQFVGENLPNVSASKGVFALDLEVKPTNRGHLLEPGVYRCALKLAAANHDPVTKIFRIEFDGYWYGDEPNMFKRVKIAPL